MLKKCIRFITISVILFTVAGCQTTQTTDNTSNDIKPKTPSDYNVKFIGFDSGIYNPDNDRHTFYKIYINKVEQGRTTTGLESQQKMFKAKLENNKHVLTVEKWVLDKKEKKYKKLNNVHQPKPNFIYFNVKEDKVVIIKLETNKYRRALYSISYE